MTVAHPSCIPASLCIATYRAKLLLLGGHIEAGCISERESLSLWMHIMFILNFSNLLLLDNIIWIGESVRFGIMHQILWFHIVLVTTIAAANRAEGKHILNG